ncbi:ABC transporter permease [Candidatus Bealeia paramacronuclearis]|uniref:ABC transporter permease n=1 Tax=Candidatus Bealeia paramacronuclearis TaxID=1921001 RepID=A0ABZ2C5E2_9PROT|nr:ABC transporter permease [Candidatus Bealeia paramacronuclearis]
MFYIAFKMLVGDRGKYLGIILGISFASLIMTQQPAIFSGLMTRTYSFITDLGLPDIWVMDPTVRYVDDGKTMPEKNLYRVASIDGVAWAKPLYKGNIQARLNTGTYQNCNLIGIDDTTLIGAPAQLIQGNIEGLWQADAVIVNEEGANDKLANPPVTSGGPKIPLRVGQEIELNDHRAVVVGIAKSTRTFQSLPVIFTTYSRAKQFVPPQRNLLSYVLVKAKPGQDIDQLVHRIEKQSGLKALPREKFKDSTIDYYFKYTGIPINFGVSVLLGFLVGAIIAGQTFYSFTYENLRYYGVLKAMGVADRTLLLMIVFQSLIVCFIGYGLGIAGTAIFAYFTKNSLLAFRFPWQLMVFSVFGVTVISALAALISIRKVLKLEPAIVFKS